MLQFQCIKRLKMYLIKILWKSCPCFDVEIKRAGDFNYFSSVGLQYSTLHQRSLLLNWARHHKFDSSNQIFLFNTTLLRHKLLGSPVERAKHCAEG